MNLVPSGTDDIILESGPSLTAPTSIVVTSPASTTYSFVYLLISNYTSNIIFQTTPQSFSVLSSSISQFLPSLPCTTSVPTSISFTLSSAPSFISIDPTTGLLSITAPEVSSDAEFSFYIESAISGVADPIRKLMGVKVMKWEVENWQKWVETKTKWEKCKDGYKNNGDGWVKEETTIQQTKQGDAGSSTKDVGKGLGIMQGSLLGVSAVVITVLTTMNGSSMAGLWSMINQIQLLFLLLLTRAYIPEEIQIEITGSSFALNYPNYLSFKSIDYYNEIFENFNYGLSNQLFSPIGIKSDSTIYNTYLFFTLLVLMTVLHISIYFLLLMLSKCRAD